MQSTRTLYVILIGLALSACSSAPQRPAAVLGDEFAYTIDYARWMVGKRMAANDIVGLSIALMDDQRIVWAQGFGHADKHNAIPATAETV